MPHQDLASNVTRKSPSGPGLVQGQLAAKPLHHPSYGQGPPLVRAERRKDSTVLPGITSCGSPKPKFRLPLGNMPRIHSCCHHQACFRWGQGWRACRWTPGQKVGISASCQTKKEKKADWAHQENSDITAKLLLYLRTNPLALIMNTEFASEIHTAVWKGECCPQGQIHSLTPSLSVSLMPGQDPPPHEEESSPRGAWAGVEQSRGGCFIKLNVLVGGCNPGAFFFFFSTWISLPNKKKRSSAFVGQNSNQNFSLCSFWCFKLSVHKK